MTQKIKLILNPATNHGRSADIAASLHPLIAEHRIDLCITEHPRQAIEMAGQAGGQGYDLVIAAGGDGTVHEVVNGLMRGSDPHRPSLGILSLGSGNDFAHILGVPDNPLAALQSCINGQPHFLDIGSVQDENGRLEYFNNTIGIGFDAAVTIRTRRMKRIHGFMMYFIATLQTILRNFRPLKLKVTTDRESWEMETIMLTLGNGPREGGGFLVTPEARLDDGILNYASIRQISRLMMLRLVPEVMKGTHARFKQVQMGTCQKMSIISQDSLPIHCDGEIYADFNSSSFKLKIEILPRALRFMKQ